MAAVEVVAQVVLEVVDKLQMAERVRQILC
jgi:hypothetical protein